MHCLARTLGVIATVAVCGSARPALAQLRPGEWTAATFNIRYDNPRDPVPWERRRDDVARVIGFYEIVGIQEALPHQWQDLQDRLPWMTSVGVGRDSDGGGETCALFVDPAKWTILHHETLWLAADWRLPGAVGWKADLPRTVLVAWLEQVSTGKVVRVYNTHWSHVSAEERLASASLIALLDAPSQADASVVLGDFNQEEGPALDVLFEAGWTDTYASRASRCRKSFPSYTTFNPEGSANGPKIDGIHTKGLEVHWTCVDEVIVDDHFISDHLPVHAVLAWPK